MCALQKGARCVTWFLVAPCATKKKQQLLPYAPSLEDKRRDDNEAAYGCCHGMQAACGSRRASVVHVRREPYQSELSCCCKRLRV